MRAYDKLTGVNDEAWRSTNILFCLNICFIFNKKKKNQLIVVLIGCVNWDIAKVKKGLIMVQQGDKRYYEIERLLLLLFGVFLESAQNYLLFNIYFPIKNFEEGRESVEDALLGGSGCLYA